MSNFKSDQPDQPSMISPQELKAILDDKNLFLLDVRNPDEYEVCDIGGHLIPLPVLQNCLNEIPKDKNIVVHCKAGPRSIKAANLLQAAGFKNVKVLQGGILGWIDEIDNSLTKY